MITDQQIIKSTGQYDKEVIQRLRLEASGIQRITNLEACVSMTDLSLSRNSIVDISGLEGLLSLRRLDLSFNKIRRIENLQELQALEHLDLRGNSIASVNDIEQLRCLPELKSLFLQESDGTYANPACSHPSYITIVMRSLPQLQILDGANLQISEAFNSLDQHIAKLTPDPDSCATPPLQPWFDGLLDSGGGKVTDIDVDEEINASKKLKDLTNTHQEIVDMINEDCSHVLRKAQSSLSKANN
mmetsp:Transcript_22278/g.37268  ORF Transcript_22278/g.37268 Transcript_22278/m.37268 type:complete len:244 (-) Transcript_22278:28-759(-)